MQRKHGKVNHVEVFMELGPALGEVKPAECAENRAADTSVSASDTTWQSAGFTSPRSGVALLPDRGVLRHGQAARLARTELLALGQNRQRPMPVQTP